MFENILLQVQTFKADFDRTCVWQIFYFRNSFPAFTYELDVGVMCLDQHKQFPNMVAVGLYDGSIAVFNIVKLVQIRLSDSKSC